MSTMRSGSREASGATPLEDLLQRARSTARRLSGVRAVEGFVDRVLAGEVLGWAFDPNKPERRVLVVARLDGEVIAESLADLPRKDLTRGGKGDGRHGFNLRIPGKYLDGAPRRLRIEAVVGRSPKLLQGGAITIAAARPGLTAARKAEEAKLEARPVTIGGLERVSDGVLHGWVAQASASAESPVVVDIYDDERYLGSSRPESSAGQGGDAQDDQAAAFQFKLPAQADAVLHQRLRARIAGGGELSPLPGAAASSPPAVLRGAAASAPGAARPRPRRAPRIVPAEGRVALLVYGGEDPDAVRRTARSWTEQTWSDVAFGRLAAAPERSSPAGEHVFTGSDLARLGQFVAQARTVVLVKAGETMEVSAARILAQARPVTDVLTWEAPDRSSGGLLRRRTEAWPLAIQLGACLNAGLAVRTGALAPLLQSSASRLAQGDIQPLERALALDPILRWAHLPIVLSSRPPLAAPGPARAPSPVRKPERISLAVWPRWSDASLATLASLLPYAANVEVEVLAQADVVSDDLQTQLSALAPSARLTLRPIDPPAQDRPGGWHRALTQAATGEVVVLARAGLSLSGPSEALMDLAGWALSPLAGAVTGEIVSGDQTLSGLSLAPARHGWRILSGHHPALAGVSRPILAASAALMAVERSKLDTVGGFDAHRLPDGGTGFDVGLRLRRAGCSNVLLGHVQASCDPRLLRRDPGSALALHDPAELAGAAAAYPAYVEARPRPAEEA